MNVNLKRNIVKFNTENTTIAKMISNEKREFFTGIFDAIQNCTDVKELSDTPICINDPYKELAQRNLTSNVVKCAIISQDCMMKQTEAYCYDIILKIGMDKLKMINYDIDKVIIFDPNAKSQGKRKSHTLIKECIDNGAKEKVFDVYGEVLIVGIDHTTETFRSLDEIDMEEIQEHIDGTQFTFPQ